jgi:hypothetical protein
MADYGHISERFGFVLCHENSFQYLNKISRKSAETGSYRMRACLAYPAAKIKVIFHD